jgi:phosphoserine phosphatase
LNSEKRLVVYIDVDDTLVRSAGTKTMPMPSMVEHTKLLADAGAELCCWSTAGGVYARNAAKRLGIDQCFAGFLPKPNVMIDDQDLGMWKRFKVVHPLNASGTSVDEYLKLIQEA